MNGTMGGGAIFYKLGLVSYIHWWNGCDFIDEKI
jgi:hypothetical protein